MRSEASSDAEAALLLDGLSEKAPERNSSMVTIWAKNSLPTQVDNRLQASRCNTLQIRCKALPTAFWGT
jgi:hypothetical protein